MGMYIKIFINFVIIILKFYYPTQEHYNFIGVIENNDNELVNFVLSIKYGNNKLKCILRYNIYYKKKKTF